MGKFKDLTGQKFGRLTVIKRGEDYIGKNGRKTIRWWCLCDCQLELPEDERELKLIIGDNLRSGHTTSCGCYHRDLLVKKNKDKKQYNKYVLTKEYGIGCTSKAQEFYFDLEDYDEIKNYTWWYDKNGYVVTKKDNITIRMHRLVMNLDTTKEKCDLEVDHINHLKHDNRKSNLRIVTRSQNIMNQKTRKDNTSGVVGVHRHENKWEVRICVDGESIYSGVFDDKKDAINKRIELEEKYFGEFSYNNSMRLSEVNIL